VHLGGPLGPGEGLMTAGEIFGLALSIAVVVYLVYALFRAEKF
jgi:K+-transporting ATPase KdpF subunit